MTFAHGGAGVLDTTSAHNVPTLAKQVDTFRKMVKNGIISEKQLSRSVALVAISGNDYYGNTGVIGLSASNDVSSYQRTKTLNKQFIYLCLLLTKFDTIMYVFRSMLILRR
jgi:hypothetical protein